MLFLLVRQNLLFGVLQNRQENIIILLAGGAGVRRISEAYQSKQRMVVGLFKIHQKINADYNYALAA